MALLELCCRGEVVHGLEPTALREEALVAVRGGKGACSEEGLCTGGDDADFSHISLPQHFCFSFPVFS